MDADPRTTASEDEQQKQQIDNTLPGTPTDAFACGAAGCLKDTRLRQVTGPAGRRRVLCPECARGFAAGGGEA